VTEPRSRPAYKAGPWLQPDRDAGLLIPALPRPAARIFRWSLTDGSDIHALPDDRTALPATLSALHCGLKKNLLLALPRGICRSPSVLGYFSFPHVDCHQLIDATLLAVTSLVDVC